MSFQNLLIENKGRILFIVINRESKLNALNRDTISELRQAFEGGFNDPNVGGIIVTGAGQKAFVAGADIAEFAETSESGGRELARSGQTGLFDLIEKGSKPVIAAINGFSLGGGLELAMACHIRIAAETAKMGLPEVTLGLIPGYGGTQRLPQLVGKGKALEMIMTADMITAAEAFQFGLVNRVTAPEDLLATAEGMMNKILSRAPLAISSAIRAVNAGFDPAMKGFEVEIGEFGRCFGTADFKEGVNAFLNKRKPEFKGE